MPPLRPVALFLLSALLGALGGCATKQVKVGSRYVVSTPKAAFYKYGPAQSFGPDTTLTKGTVVTMLESTWGFCHVMTDSGLSGYISSDDVKPAPAQAVAAAIPAPKPGGGAQPAKPQFFSGRPKKNTYTPTPGGLLFDVNDVPLPISPLDDPLPVGPKAKPKFRY